ncbi:HNH endonuclease [Thalassospira xiamenensis]|jgi:hypothetical protein|uniref:HNH endonuclease n=1 Tax=Thalassospira xiamenensis TaxID=220697 RepID=UPI0007A49612|nr:HNH endonuclease [Thalassospira xiamenensis]KZB52429.1 hypothetical protein AUP41_03640 [Thalassospira xiamenensis]
MAKRAGDFSKLAVRVLRERVNGICSNPKCNRSTSGPSKTHHAKSTITGEAAHIHAASPGGARYDSKQSPEERSSIENGIWLCGTCASLIDKNGGDDYSPAKLKYWKAQAEERAHNALETSNNKLEKPWDSEFSNINYMNIPRIAMIAASANQQLSSILPDNVVNLHDLGFELNRVTLEVQRSLRHIFRNAVPIEELASIDGDYRGLLVSFDRRFYTKNGPPIPEKGKQFVISEEWENAPHLHGRVGQLKVILAYDPRWITTTTAYGEFNRGNSSFKGLGIVKEVDTEQGLIFLSPLLIGLPKSNLLDLIMNSSRTENSDLD